MEVEENASRIEDGDPDAKGLNLRLIEVSEATQKLHCVIQSYLSKI